MILTGSQIIEEVKNKRIVLDPFDVSQVNPNSYNYKIWNKIKKFVVIGDATTLVEEEILPSGYYLSPHQMYLASTYETIWSSDYMVSLIGRSSLWRLWLFLQLSANIWHTWTSHKRTLELVSTKPLIIYPLMKIGQVSFWVNEWKLKHYTGRYKDYNNPKESLLLYNI